MRREPVLTCYRTSCHNAAHPCGYNRITHGLYCLDCAEKINRGTPTVTAAFFPLLTFACGPRRVALDGGSYVPGIILVRPQAGITIEPKEPK